MLWNHISKRTFNAVQIKFFPLIIWYKESRIKSSHTELVSTNCRPSHKSLIYVKGMILSSPKFFLSFHQSVSNLINLSYEFGYLDTRTGQTWDSFLFYPMIMQWFLTRPVQFSQCINIKSACSGAGGAGARAGPVLPQPLRAQRGLPAPEIQACVHM